MAEKIYTIKQAAEHLSYKPNTVREYLKRGILKGIKVGNEWRIPDTDLQAYIDGLKAKRDSRE